VELNYTFEPTSNEMYQVRLCDDFFVCYSYNKDEKSVDEYLKREGFKSRREYFDACLLENVEGELL
jgi:hypothetical protein